MCVCALPPKIRTTIKRVGITLKGGAGAERGGKGREEMSWDRDPNFVRVLLSLVFSTSLQQRNLSRRKEEGRRTC